MNTSQLLGALILGATSLTSIAADAPAKVVDGALVAANGMTVYTFDKDAADSGKSTCNGPCAAMWPPLAAGTTDQAAGSWSIVNRDGGARQWAYKGKPLYFYQTDKKAGERSGDNFKEVWHIVKE